MITLVDVRLLPRLFSITIMVVSSQLWVKVSMLYTQVVSYAVKHMEKELTLYGDKAVTVIVYRLYRIVSDVMNRMRVL